MKLEREVILVSKVNKGKGESRENSVLQVQMVKKVLLATQAVKEKRENKV